MEAQQVNLKQDGYRFNCNTYKPKSHYKFIMRMGRVFPNSKAQAKYFLKEGITIDVLNYDDVQYVESFLNKHGFKGDYKYTKNKNWVRLKNQDQLHEALKKQYELN